MFAPEVAKERLKEWQVEAEEERFLPRAKSLPEGLRTIAFGLLQLDGKGEPLKTIDYRERHKLRQPLIEPIDDLSPGDRLKLFLPFFCDLAPSVESTWQLLKQFPYQHSPQRKSFRAARDTRATRDLRLAWLDAMMRIAFRFKPEALKPEWLAAWATHIDTYGHVQNAIARLLAAVMEDGGRPADEVFEILCQSIRNEHEIGGVGRHAIRALLMASRPEGWELVERTLIAAQRQEGLRQVILETVDEAHPTAYLRMLRLIRDQELARFSAVVRAVNVWFGLNWDSVSVKVVNTTIDRVIGFLEDPSGLRAGSDLRFVLCPLPS